MCVCVCVCVCVCSPSVPVRSTQPTPPCRKEKRFGVGAMDSPCECEHNNPDSLDARLFPSVVLAVAPAVTMDEASYLFGLGFTTTAEEGVSPNLHEKV